MILCCLQDTIVQKSFSSLIQRHIENSSVVVMVLDVATNLSLSPFVIDRSIAIEYVLSKACNGDS